MTSAAEIFFAYQLKGTAQVAYVNQLQQVAQADAQREAEIAARPRVPVRTADTLASSQYATFIDLLSEGEIEGFPSAAGLTKNTAAYDLAALKDIYLNKVAILSASADLANVQSTDYNHKDIKIDLRYGTQSQSYFNGYGEISDPVQVNQEVQFALPITQTISDSSTDGVIITISIPRMEEYNSLGDVLGSSFGFKIQIKYFGDATFTDLKVDTITGRTADSYQRDYRVDFKASPTFPIDIRLSRTTADSTDPSLVVNSFFFAYYQEVIYQKLRYPNSALAAIRFDAENYSSIPSRSYRVRGIKVKIPTGVTVDQTNGRIIYPSPYVFNGTFAATKAWTTDPAWILFDLLINTRYGLGAHIAESQLDSYSFFTASKYASALVADGFGGTEPRFSCNALIQNQDNAYTLINDLCSVMRVMPYWSTGSLTISQDAPADAACLFTLANVGEEGFNYTGSSITNRHTAAVVAYQDLLTQDINYEIVEDTVGINKYGWEPSQIKAFACTSRGQASRMGRWLIYSETEETDVVNFKISVSEGVIVRPGQIIKIADPLKAAVRRGGRIAAATTTTITVDNVSNTDLATTNSPTMSIIMPDGTIETKTISSVAGAVVTLASALTTTPNVNSIWMIQNTTVESTTWRVLSITEADPTSYAVTALMHNASKYTYVESGQELTRPNTTAIPFKPLPPDGVQAQEIIYAATGRAAVKIAVSWQPIRGVSEYLIQYRVDNGNWRTASALGPNYEIIDTSEGFYEIKVFSFNALKAPSDPSTITFTAVGKTAVPGDVQGLTIEPISANSARLRWVETVDLDVKIGGKIHIRHSSLTDGTGTWSNSVDLIPAKSGSSTEAIVPLISGEICVKFEDDGGRQSTNETSVIVDFPDALDPLAIQARREDADAPPFQGVKTNVFYSDEYDALTLDGSDDIDDVVDFDLISTFDILGNVSTTGSYAFANTLDLGNVFSLDLNRYFVTRGYYPADLVDSRANDVDDWPDWDGGVIDKVNAKLLLRSTNDNPLSSPTWSSYREFVNGTFKGRAFEFKAELTSNAIDQNILIDELGYNASFQRRTEQSATAIASGAAALAVVFANQFFTGTSVLGGVNAYLPSIGITAQNMATGDFFVVTSISATGFTVEFKNAAGTAVNRNFNWSAVGFGNAG